MDRIVAVACIAFVGLSAWSVRVPAGEVLPTYVMLPLVVALAILLLGHMWKHLGTVLMAAFVSVAAIVEWAFEESNIQWNGFIWGDIRYGDMTVFSVHVGSVPIVVPLLMAVILWPTYAAVNLALDGRVVVNPQALTWWQNVWRCVLYGFVHSWMMLMCNELCVTWGVYRWVGHSAERPPEEMFLGDPAAPGGWLIYVVVSMLVFTTLMVPWLGRNAVERAAHRPLQWADGAPILFWAVMAVQNYLNPVNNATVANVVMWTLGFFAAFAGYRFVDVMRSERKSASVVTEGAVPARE